MKSARLVITFLLFVGIVFSAAAITADESSSSFVIIVNESNSVSSLTKSQVSKIFMKKVVKWKDGQRIMPIDLKGSRGVFAEEIHGRSEAALENYWKHMIFSGRGVPPVEVRNDSEVLGFVATNPNAIGYISSKIALENVKTLTVKY